MNDNLFSQVDEEVTIFMIFAEILDHCVNRIETAQTY